MIIFGTRSLTTTPESGNFNCPSCNNVQPYGLKRVRRFFTLYFIPVIPLDKLGEYVECKSCKDTYKNDILKYDPAANSEAFEAEYHVGIKKVMIHVLLADGVIDDSEVEVVMDIYQRISGNEISKESLLDEIKNIQKTNESLSNILLNLSGTLNDEGKERVIQAAVYVALADGEFQQEEADLVSKIGKELGMTKAHTQGVVSSVAT
ncbi:MAG: TerB family tellurite resistance protein [Saccharospirillaceae bacterium]|nr:TerB family tellurite resistance protein [Pseudomonadales bacterium]NRB81611.1 TerB family tellurite resistance protein [Saccharospirillaceae bacterium]